LIIAIFVALLVLFAVYLNGRRLHRRERAILALLDGADAFEAQLHECKQRMQRLRDMLTILPQEMSARADQALSADPQVAAALKDLLAHRLWIQQHAQSASRRELADARAAMNQSSTTLAEQIERLDEITRDLKRAQASAKTVTPNAS